MKNQIIWKTKAVTIDSQNPRLLDNPIYLSDSIHSTSINQNIATSCYKRLNVIFQRSLNPFKVFLHQTV